MTSDQHEQVFHETSERLKSQKNALDDKGLLDVYHRVLEGVSYLTRRYAQWWASVEPRAIDVAQPETDPYRLAIEGFGLSKDGIMALSPRESADNGFRPEGADPREAEALNAFWRAIVEELRREPLKLAI